MSANVFYDILKSVFINIVYEYSDYPMFLPEISTIINQLAKDKKIKIKELLNATKPDESSDDY